MMFLIKNTKIIKEDLIDTSDKSSLSKKANYISSCENLILKNGGQFYIGNKEYFSVNTCSIDYFLIIIYIICSNHMDLVSLLKNEISTVFEKIYVNLSSNEWQKARLAWVEYCPELRVVIQKNNVFDWFLSEYEAFFVYYRSNQFYTWISKCDNLIPPLCENSLEMTKNSYTFILK